MQDLSKFRLPDNFRGKNALIVQLWWFTQSTLFALSPRFAYGWRRFLLRLFGAEIGKKVLVRPSAKITYPWKLKIGDWSWIGDDVVLYTLGEIEIGKNTVISQKSYICTGSHDMYSENFDIFAEKIVIKDGCWIATDVFVAPGVVIEKNVVVGARSSVFHSLPENSICLGTPAKPVKKRF